MEFRKRESAQLALVVTLCRRVVTASEAVTAYADGPERAEETRTALYTEIARLQQAIAGLFAIHLEGSQLDA